MEKEKQFYKEPSVETKEKEPKISYEIFYSSHGTATDLKKLAQPFSGTDVYVPECAGWTPEILADFNAVSQGKKTPQELIYEYGIPKNSSWAGRWEIIYQSQKPILFADLGMGHALHALKEKVDSLYDQSFEEFEQGNFSGALQIMRDYVQTYAELQEKREKIMLDNLEARLNDLIKNSEDLKNKKEIKVLLDLGAGHTPIFHSLKEKELKTKWQFSDSPSVFVSRDEAIRRARFFKEIKDDLLAKIFIEGPLDNYFCLLTDDSDKIARIVRHLSVKISFEEIENFSKNKGQIPGPLRIINFFQNKGIKIPKTEKEIDEMLKLADHHDADL